jgi:hypothetical protein
VPLRAHVGARKSVQQLRLIAKQLGEAVRKVKAFRLVPEQIETNLVWFDVDSTYGSAADVVAKLNVAVNAAIAEPEVAKKLAEALRDLDKGITAPRDGRITVGEYLDSWLLTKKADAEAAAGLAMAMYASGAGLRQIFAYLLGGFEAASWWPRSRLD